MELKQKAAFIVQSDVFIPHSDAKKWPTMDTTSAPLSWCSESSGWWCL